MFREAGSFVSVISDQKSCRSCVNFFLPEGGWPWCNLGDPLHLAKVARKQYFDAGQEHAFGQRVKGRWILWLHVCVYQVEELNVEKCFHGFHFPTP